MILRKPDSSSYLFCMCIFSDIHWSIVLSIFGFIGFLITLVVAILINGDVATKHIFPPSFHEWGLLIAVGLLSFVVQVCFTKALQYEKASTASLERQASDVIFAFLFQVTIFQVIYYSNMMQFIIWLSTIMNL